jgi:ABC-type multidrug transport system permease subunit
MSIEKLFYIVQKNLRLVFRNWTSFLLLILGPMLLILIVGYAFQGEDLHDIALGVHAAPGADIRAVIDALSSQEIHVVYFPQITHCIAAMNHSEIHICADFSSDFQEGAGEITFYYDTTRYNLVRYILEYLQERVALTSEKISLELAEQIFADINLFVSDMQTGQTQVQELHENALLLREDLVALYENVSYARQQFEGPYFRIKEAQEELNTTLVEATSTYSASTNISVVLHDLYDVTTRLSGVNATVAAAEASLGALKRPYNKSRFIEIYTMISQTDAHVQETITALESTGNLTEVSLAQTMQLLEEVNTVVGSLDAMYVQLVSTEEGIAVHNANVDAGVENLDGLSASFDTYIAKFSAFGEVDAEKFLHPISATFVAVPSAEIATKIQLLFPILLIFMITFISILLSNMLVLNETHSPAYFRNFLIPVSDTLFIAGIFFTALVVVGIQILVLLALAHFNFAVDLSQNFPTFLLGLVLATIVFVEVGMIFGYLVRQRQTSLLLSLFFSLILFFFSNIVYPLEIMPKAAAFVARLTPFVVAQDIFREVLFFGYGVSEQALQFSVLSFYVVFFGLLAFAAYYWNKRRR